MKKMLSCMLTVLMIFAVLPGCGIAEALPETASDDTITASQELEDLFTVID